MTKFLIITGKFFLWSLVVLTGLSWLAILLLPGGEGAEGRYAGNLLFGSIFLSIVAFAIGRLLAEEPTSKQILVLLGGWIITAILCQVISYWLLSEHVITEASRAGDIDAQLPLNDAHVLFRSGFWTFNVVIFSLHGLVRRISEMRRQRGSA